MDEGRESLTVCAVAGSLRKDSYNRMLLRAAMELAPAHLRIRPFERLGEIPPFNADVEAEGVPEPVAALKTAIREADGLLIATPEYNYGPPGLLKNAIDWASRPPRNSPLQGKPIALMGASPGMGGTARAQLSLRQAFIFTRSLPVTGPEILVARAHERFDEEGRLVHDATRGFLVTMLSDFADWIVRLRPGG